MTVAEDLKVLLDRSPGDDFDFPEGYDGLGALMATMAVVGEETAETIGSLYDAEVPVPLGALWQLNQMLYEEPGLFAKLSEALIDAANENEKSRKLLELISTMIKLASQMNDLGL